MRIVHLDCVFAEVDLGLAKVTSELPNWFQKFKHGSVGSSANEGKTLSLLVGQTFWYCFESGILSAGDREFVRHELYKNGGRKQHCFSGTLFAIFTLKYCVLYFPSFQLFCSRRKFSYEELKALLVGLKLHMGSVLWSGNLIIFFISFPNIFSSQWTFSFFYSNLSTSLQWWRLVRILTCLILAFEAHMNIHSVGLQPEGY